MQDLFRRGEKIIVARTARPMIYRASWNHTSVANEQERFRLHPLALDKFIEILDKQGKKK